MPDTTYLLLLWAPRQILQTPRTADEAQASGQRWHAWSASLEAAGKLAGGAQLQPSGAHLTGDQVVEGTFGDDFEVGGYFLITAGSLEEATTLAQGCPLIDAGGTVEVRPLIPAR